MSSFQVKCVYVVCCLLWWASCVALNFMCLPLLGRPFADPLDAFWILCNLVWHLLEQGELYICTSSFHNRTVSLTKKIISGLCRGQFVISSDNHILLSASNLWRAEYSGSVFVCFSWEDCTLYHLFLDYDRHWSIRHTRSSRKARSRYGWCQLLLELWSLLPSALLRSGLIKSWISNR